MSKKNNNFKYFMMTKQDQISAFVRTNAKWIIIFCVILILGLTVGIISTLKPVDPFAALATHNKAIFEVIENASYMQFLFSSILTFFLIIALSAFIGRFPYSVIFLMALTVVLGYFQGGTVILVVRVYGVISLPLAICFSVLSLFVDLALFCFFSTLVKCSKERRKYGCKTSFIKTLLGSVYVMVFVLVAVLVRYFLVIVFAFFL